MIVYLKVKSLDPVLEEKKAQKRVSGYMVLTVLIKHCLYEKITANFRVEWSQCGARMAFQSASFRKLLPIPEILIQKDWKVDTCNNGKLSKE